MDEKEPLDHSNLDLSKGDYAHSLIKGGLGVIPFVGSVLGEIFGLAKESPLEKRKKEYFLAVNDRLETLVENSKIDISKLKKNEEFIDILIQSYEIALKNSQQEKLKLLQNAVVNTALEIDITQDEKLIFLEVLSRITLSHYKVLKMWYDPEDILKTRISEKYQEGLSETTQVRLPDILNEHLRYDEGFYQTILSDLNSWNLINSTYSTHHLDEAQEIIIERMCSNIRNWQTSSGERFLQFVESAII